MVVRRSALSVAFIGTALKPGFAALFALSRCNRDADETVVTTTTENTMTAVDDNNGVIAATQNAADSTLLAGASGLGAYLAGTDALPGRFVFEKVQFDTNKSDIRAQDRAELDDVAKVLKSEGVEKDAIITEDLG